MIVTYLRSSSYTNWDFCQMQYYITYVLGHNSPSGQKAEQGTVVHKVMEVLANIKKQIQDQEEDGIPADERENFVDDENIGVVHYNPDSLLEATFLSNDEVDKINKGRRNKSIYKSPCKIEHGHFRLGVSLVESIFEKAYTHYVDKSIHKWQPAHKRDCLNWTWMCLDYKAGLFDPRKRNIHTAEKQFDIEIDKPWAKFDYIAPNGDNLVGNFAIKGTIDLITQPYPNVLEVIDWKTGQRIAWGKAGTPVKTFEVLQKDPQLMLYFYALSHLYPDAEHILFTIFFVRDGGPFTVYFDKDDLPKIENMLRDRFVEIKNSTRPIPVDANRRDFKCTRLCHFYKTKFCASDEHNMCRTVENEIKEHGIDFVNIHRTKPGHNVGIYHSPGE